MIDEHVNNPKSPQYHVRRYLRRIKNELKGKTVLDIPAGNGVTTEILQELECNVEPYDLFPEYFMLKNIECKRADINDRIPVNNAHADYIICQEGIEHFSDQPKPLKTSRIRRSGKSIKSNPFGYANNLVIIFMQDSELQLPSMSASMAINSFSPGRPTPPDSFLKAPLPLAPAPSGTTWEFRLPSQAISIG